MLFRSVVLLQEQILVRESTSTAPKVSGEQSITSDEAKRFSKGATKSKGGRGRQERSRCPTWRCRSWQTTCAAERRPLQAPVAEKKSYQLSSLVQQRDRQLPPATPLPQNPWRRPRTFPKSLFAAAVLCVLRDLPFDKISSSCRWERGRIGGGGPEKDE